VTPKVAMNARSSVWSMRYAPVVPEQVELLAYELTEVIVLVPATKIGPPESPKQVPPVAALLENFAEMPPPIPPTPLRLTSRRSARRRVSPPNDVFGPAPSRP
jgi:hypothetical protein